MTMRILLLLLAGALLAAAEAPPRRTLLVIGNSQSRDSNLETQVPAIVNAMQPGWTLAGTAAVLGGSSLEYHCTGVRGGRPPASPTSLAILRGAAWDIVSIQEHGNRYTLPDQRPLYERHARELKAAAGRARVLIFSRQATLEKAFQAVPEEQRQERMAATLAALQPAVEALDREVAGAIGAEVVPAGAAWVLAARERPSLRLFYKDWIHPSALGAYLTACTFAAVITGRSPEGVAVRTAYGRAFGDGDAGGYGLSTLDDDTALFLQRCAWRAVQGEDHQERSGAGRP